MFPRREGQEPPGDDVRPAKHCTGGWHWGLGLLNWEDWVVAARRCAWGRDFCSGWKMRAEPLLGFFFPCKEGGDSGEIPSSLWDGNGQSHHVPQDCWKWRKKTQFIAIYEFKKKKKSSLF